MVSHESVAGLLGLAARVLSRPAARLADTLNSRTAKHYQQVVCTTEWAAAEFARLGVENLFRVPLGVDLELFSPGRYSVAVRDTYAGPDEVLLVHCGRLSVEKKPERSIDAVAFLTAQGVRCSLVVAGDGPLRERLEKRAAGLPVRFTGFIHDRQALAGLLATADVVLAPGPVETFGLAALEALACGTPVVVSASSALPEVIGAAGVAVAAPEPNSSASSSAAGIAFADGIRQVLGWSAEGRREAARQRAEEFGWPAAVAGFLAAHGLRDERVPDLSLAGLDRLAVAEWGDGG
jgi:alpha-1,6-mannosyltransferase